MAKVEKDFLERKNPTERNFKAKPFMPRKPIPDLGHEKLDGKINWNETIDKGLGYTDTLDVYVEKVYTENILRLNDS